LGSGEKKCGRKYLKKLKNKKLLGCAIVDVGLAVFTLVAVDANALVAALLVGAGGAVDARVDAAGTLVHVAFAVLAAPLWRHGY